jgi:hypothetical protein
MTGEARLPSGTVSFSVGRNGGPKTLVIDSQRSQKSGQQIQQFASTAETPLGAATVLKDLVNRRSDGRKRRDRSTRLICLGCSKPFDQLPCISSLGCDKFAYSALAAMRIGMSGSASFQSVRKSLYAARARTRAASASVHIYRTQRCDDGTPNVGNHFW